MGRLGGRFYMRNLLTSVREPQVTQLSTRTAWLKFKHVLLTPIIRPTFGNLRPLTWDLLASANRVAPGCRVDYNDCAFCIAGMHLSHNKGWVLRMTDVKEHGTLLTPLTPQSRSSERTGRASTIPAEVALSHPPTARQARAKVLSKATKRFDQIPVRLITDYALNKTSLSPEEVARVEELSRNNEEIRRQILLLEQRRHLLEGRCVDAFDLTDFDKS